jgi:hypothetical protein
MADWRGGSYLSEVMDHTSFTFCEAQTIGEWWYHETRRQFIKSFQRAQEAGLDIHLNFQDSDPVKVVRLASPVWSSIKVLDVMDESPLKLRAMSERCIVIDNAVFNAALPSKPINAVFTSSQIKNLNGWKSPYLDSITIEAYVIDKDFRGDSGQVLDECKKVLQPQLDILPNKPIIVIGQSFTGKKSGIWPDLGPLVDLQYATYEVARADDRVTHIRWFNYGRKDGARYHPKLIAAHKAIAKKEAA